MSLETRSSSALFKRAEQLKRWEQSETNREPTQPRQVARKIKFSADIVFLAACAASDKEEVVRLLQRGADINTGNVDGLTALHQACIDDDLDMVEFLVEQGADINRGDNEGWTPLHATASCGFISIAKYLIEQGCNLAAVNNDGELALDIAESDEMEDMLQQHINKAGIDCDQARSEEERSMLNDAKAWRSGAPGKDSMHPRSGATALHVAAAKGYIKVMHILLQARCNVDAQDFDGWTPLHGAAHWGQLEACKLLVENGCDMDMKNYADQTAFDIADADILKALENLREQQALSKENSQTNNKKQSSIPKKRFSTSADNAVAAQESTEIFEEETPNKVKKVELEIQSDKEDSSTSTNSDVVMCISYNIAAWTEATRETHMEESDGEGESETSSESHSSTFSNQSDKSNHATCLTDDEKKNRVNKDESAPHSPISPVETNKVPNQAPILPPKQQTDNNEDGVVPSWRRSGSFRNRMQSTETTNSASTKLEDKDNNIKIPTTPNKVSAEPDVVLRRTHSFETDEKFYEQYLALRARIKAFSCPTLHRCNAATPTHTNATTRSASLRETHRKKDVKLNLELSRLPQGSNTLSPTSASKTLVSSLLSSITTTTTATTTTSPIPVNQIRSVQPVEAASTVVSNTNNAVATAPGTPTTPGGSKLSPGNLFKNFFKSFVPPVRDEESETQRKAHAKRVRETRRSTQGVTLDEIKSAEQLVKKKQQNNELPASAPSTQPSTTTTTTTTTTTATTTTTTTVSNTASITATITTATSTTVTPVNKVSEESNLPERRPSWRLRVDNGSKFQLEDANNKPTDNTTYMRRPSGGTGVPRPSSAPVETIATSSTETTVTLPLRRSLKQPDDKEQDKENDSRNAQATQAVIQRRRRPKRRSTGVVHVDMDEIDPEKQDLTAGGDCDDSKINHNEGAQTKPTTAAGLRAQASTNGQSIFGNRSRIGGLLSLNPNNLTFNAGLLGVKSPNLYSGSNFLNKNKKSSNLFRTTPFTKSTNSPNYQNLFTTYGGTSTGYGGVTLPSHTAVSPLNLSPSPSYNYLNLNVNTRPHMQKTESFKRSKVKPNLNIGSRSSSLQSLTSSEGYVSGNDRSGRATRLGSISSLSSEASSTPIRLKSNSSENGELDYKKLYEESQVENERLKDKLKRSDEQLKEVRHLLEKMQINQNKVILSEAEKRERRAMERKLSEMEEELKVMDQLKCENQRLKDENGALIRVISKLSK
ncbi:Protein phosphatase 1 regulatory subunit 12A [Trachymyrmex septentrionalis]|uniref:Protein phosphatase 1 regulatory subunit 12B n=1 Tax=Trachymyrmex septentrionalis TaxID=34720 RepID=A0A195FP68_9HYME|nr:Protein phosphatase 1 regulatory subunit 12A [Trachymyrmex septentrionalis]